MSLSNRPPGSAPFYDDDGHLVGGTDSIEALSAALMRDAVTGGRPIAVRRPNVDEHLASSFSSPSSLGDEDEGSVKPSPTIVPNGTHNVATPGRLLKRRFFDNNVVDTMLVRDFSYVRVTRNNFLTWV
jgi:hypothetical protein